VKKEIEFKAWIENYTEMMNLLRQYGEIETTEVVQYIYKNRGLDYFARIAVWNYGEGVQKAFLTIKKDLMKSGEKNLTEGNIVVQDELETEIPFSNVAFYQEVFLVLGLSLHLTRKLVKNKVQIEGVTVTIDRVDGKYHLEIESTGRAKINKVQKLLLV
jgi:adenylate cyclase class IV